MAFITLNEARNAGLRTHQRSQKTASRILLDESSVATHAQGKWDIFLSHSMTDADVVLGVKRILEAAQLSVFVDWVEHPQLDRSKVTPAVADMLRVAMRASSSLVFATSETSSSSKWMPWELGFFDGLKGNVAILPLVAHAGGSFHGQEYLGLYPVVEDVSNMASSIHGGTSRSLGVVRKGAAVPSRSIPLRAFAGR